MPPLCIVAINFNIYVFCRIPAHFVKVCDCISSCWCYDMAGIWNLSLYVNGSNVSKDGGCKHYLLSNFAYSLHVCGSEASTILY
jgi:hypothetical protein